MSILAAIGAACLSAPASAQTSYLHGVVFTTNAPAVQQSFTNAEIAALPNLRALDAIGNDAKATGSLATPGGMFKLSSHACSGGGPGFGGQANGSADAFVTLDYVILSPTLPAGTPVLVSVRWAISASVKAIGQDLVGANSSANASAYGRVTIYVNGLAIVNPSGTCSFRHNTFDGINHGCLGNLDLEASPSDTLTFTVPLGLPVRVYMEGSAGSASSSEGNSTLDADVQMAMVWGVTALTSGCTAVLQSDHNQAAPPAEAATPEHAASLRDPRPTGPGILQCFRIPTQPLPITACPAGGATFSVVVLGTGPFTYQWRKGGVPIDTSVGGNPSAATATLSLTNSSAADAGSYDCIITNPCGPLTSNAATLTISSPPSVSAQPTNIVTCPTGSAPFMVTAAGPGPLTYTWQVQSAPNGAWSSPGNDPGSPLPCGGFAYVLPGNSRSVTIGIRPCPSATPGAPQHFQVRCIITSPCGSVTSSEANYTICPADFNCSGAVNVQDIFDFLSAWFAADPRADFNGIGGITVADIFDFLAAWFAGCP